MKESPGETNRGLNTPPPKRNI